MAACASASRKFRIPATGIARLRGQQLRPAADFGVTRSAIAQIHQGRTCAMSSDGYGFVMPTAYSVATLAVVLAFLAQLFYG